MSISYSMSTRAGITIADYLTYGGLSGSAALMDTALDIAWADIEERLGTNIIEAAEYNEFHLYPWGASDYDRRFDRVYTEKTHVTGLSSVLITETVGCTCTTTAYSGCAVILNGRTGLVAVNECSISAAHACGSCRSLRPFQAILNYVAGVFPTSTLDKDIIIAVVLKAREVFSQLQPGPVQNLGAINVTSWRSMDYSESRAAPKDDESYLDTYINRLIKPYGPILRALGLRRGGA